MAQARVTDFFSQRKKGAAGAAKQQGPGGGAPSSRTRTRTRSTANKDPLICSSAVHEEFLRVIDEAAGLSDGGCRLEKGLPDSPRTPKRSSEEGEGDLGDAGFTATNDRCTAKKRRQVENRETTAKSSARKRLLLPDRPKALCKEDITALKSRLQRIQKQAEGAPGSAPSSPSPPAPASPTHAPPTGSRASVAAARELAARVQRRKEEAQRRKEERGVEEVQRAADSVERPAYQRYHTLAQAVAPGLTLPLHYRVLAEMFRSMDTVVALLHNRSETATFSKIKQAVQDMMHKRFEESHVGQIKTVFPEAYSFKQEKNVSAFSSSVRGSYQLTVEPLIPSDQSGSRPALSASRLLERRHIFQQNLVALVKQHHRAFLSTLAPPVSVPDDKLTRWHPRFNVDSVPNVQAGPLPQVPQGEKLVTAQEVLDKARSLITPKMEKALESVALKTEPTESSGSSCPPPAPPHPPASLRGVPQALLDRIRAKEAQKLQAAMTRSPAQEQRLLMLSRLGELARILRSVFVAEKKAALTMEVACNRMVASYRSALSTGEMERHVRLLGEVAADWLSILPIRKDVYLKLNKKVELSLVLDKLSSRIREENQTSC
ncbi:DNA replication factor Cdt1 isoform 2-T3 [Menidia menidia]